MLSLATISRAASSSLRGWQVLLGSLFDIAKQHVPLARVVRGHPYPEHWDSQPFVLSIGQAMVELAEAKLCKNIVGNCNLFSRCSRSVFSLKYIHMPVLVQKTVHSALLTALHPSAWMKSIPCKMGRLYEKAGIDIPEYDYFSLLTALKAGSGHVALAYVKTVYNAWTTGMRLHLADRTGCVFGCKCDDDLAHYFVCPELGHAVAWALGHPLPVLFPNILHLFPPPPCHANTHILTVFLYFTIYHVYRNSGETRTNARSDKVLRISSAAVEKARSLGIVHVPSSSASVSRTRFVEGGDHFMTTPFTS